MLAIFKNNKPTTFLAILILFILLKINVFIAPELAINKQSGGILYNLLSDLFSNTHPYFGIFASSILIFIQGNIVNQLCNKYKLIDSLTLLPLTIFVILSSISTEYAVFSPALVANTFIILSIRKGLSLHKEQKPILKLYDMGFLIGLSSLIYSPYILFFILSIILLSTFRILNVKELLICFLGLLTPYLFITSYLFLTDKLPGATVEVLNSLVYQTHHFDLSLGTYILIDYILVLYIISDLFFLGNKLKHSIQARHTFMIFNYFLIIGILSALLEKDLFLSHFSITFIPLSIYLAYIFNNIKKSKFVDILFFLLILQILYCQYQSKLEQFLPFMNYK